MKVLVFDTETTGLPEKGASIYDKDKWPHIIQISYILYDLSTNLVLVKDNYIKIDDSTIIDPESFNIHHISREMLNEKGINIVVALKEFNECLNICDIVVGHNISFDKRMIFVEGFRNKVKQNFTSFISHQKITKPEFCTMKNTTTFCQMERIDKNGLPYFKTPSLTELYLKLFPTESLPANLHNSLVDVLMTIRCYIKFCYNMDIIEVNETISDTFRDFC